jgi:hypothetical protein
MRLVEIEQKRDLITMWHGGRELEYSYREMLGNKSKQMEYGPGLYLTNYYSTAYKYAKGGGKTFLVTFRSGTSIDTVNISLETAFEFIKRHRLAKKSDLVAYIKRKYEGTINLEQLMNLMINFESMTPGTSSDVRQFIVDQGADYLVSHGYGGFSDQTIVVIFNPKIITKVEAVPAIKVTTDMHHLTPIFP